MVISPVKRISSFTFKNEKNNDYSCFNNSHNISSYLQKKSKPPEVTTGAVSRISFTTARAEGSVIMMVVL
jgi:hypothetical protein